MPTWTGWGHETSCVNPCAIRPFLTAAPTHDGAIRVAMSAPHQRQALIDAGFRLAQRITLAELEAGTVAAEAGLDAVAFNTHFGGIEQYLIGLQQHFMDGLKAAVIAATLDLPPGYERAQKGALAYLDGCLAQRGLRGWLLKARLEQAALSDNLRRQNQGYLLILPSEFSALHWPHPQAGARMFLAALWEIARLEHGLGRVSGELRGALWQFLRTYDGR